MTDIARGNVEVGINDEAALSGLRRVEVAFERTMRRIGAEEAVATVDVDIREADRKLELAKAKLRELKGARAEATITADKRQLDRAILAAEKEIAILDGRKASVQI